MTQTAIIIGAGPAGLTAAYELLSRTNIKPIVLERFDYMGGISRTVEYKGNRMDIGGHRFFSKSDRVMNWWLEQLPQEAPGQAEREDDVMLVRHRKSRIYFLRKFFEYPVQLSAATLRNLGPWRTCKIGVSYLKAMAFPIRKVENLEQFFINRFGRELYATFFKSYTEKVWGVPCNKISAEWGAQRIKGLSIRKALLHFLQQSGKSKQDIAQKEMETSLIEQFLYPKLGPGQMWEKVARRVQEMGGEVVTNFNVTGVEVKDGRVVSVKGRDGGGAERTFPCDYCFSTTSVKELVQAMSEAGSDVPPNVRDIAARLEYRDFIAVGLLVDKLKVRDPQSQPGQLVADNWIYIQEPDVLVGRLQVFNNWSPYLVADPAKVWVGAEYFCYEGDEMWTLSREEMANLAADELARIGILERADVRDSVVVHMAKTYPAYFGVYPRFPEVRAYVDGIQNLFLVGRNGMHKYNNQDHSMLTAMTAVDNIAAGVTDKSNIWDVNTEQDYHESKEK
ncbi:MAG: NAD(P)/FAD-dependent oxidoreductase [Acidobacteriota bacterium]|nr:NAD(P)/FAD-dependent oxidoreductase [Acidobacteriota bacterium]